MGRREGGSLFHQMITVPGIFENACRKDKSGNPLPLSGQTIENYLCWMHKGADYFKAQGIRRLTEIGPEQIQDYADLLQSEGKSASAIHSYLVPICKAAGISLAEIKKPIRHASEYMRSTGRGAKSGGRPAELNRMLGIRENELRHLRGSDLIVKDGITYVIVRSGKGGKYHEQKVLPQYEEYVGKFFDCSEKKLFLRSEFFHNFDYHGQRRALAQKAYEY